jgi:soluble lytic murein transglycosylase-like protein
MANMTNNQAGAQDKFQIGTPSPGQVDTPNFEAEVPWRSFQDLSRATEGFGQQVTQMAAAASQRAGIAQANTDIANGTAAPKTYGPASNDAYNQTLLQNTVESRKADMLTQLRTAEIAHPNDVQGFQDAVSAIGQAYKDNPSPFPEADAELHNFWTLQVASSLGKVQEGQEQARIANGRGAMFQAMQTGSSLLGQAVDGADWSDQGAQVVAAASNQYVKSLAKYGPRTAFDVGGQHFDADPTRLQVATPAEIEENARQTIEQARVSWIYNAAEKLPTSAAQAEFRDEVANRYRSNDPAFAGISGPQMDTLERRLRMLVVHSSSDERAQTEQVGQETDRLIEAYRWSGDPSLIPQMVQAAEKSGDPARIAKAHTIAVANVAMPGVLEDVARGVLTWNTPPGLPETIKTPEDFANLVTAVIGNESGGVNGKVNPKSGASGLMQVMPATAQEVAARLGLPWDPDRLQHDAAYNRAIGTEYLKEQVQRYNGNTALALAAYDAGPGNVDQWVQQIGDPRGGQITNAAWSSAVPFRETRDYIAKANQATGRYQAWLGAKSGFASDPLTFAHTQGAATIPALDPNGAFTQDGQGQFAAALQQRAAVGQSLAQRFGVPARLLTNSERDAITDQIKADPTKAVTIAQLGLRALGPDGAHQLLREIGQNAAGPEMHIADLTAMQAPIVSSAIAGMRLKAEGAKEGPKYPAGHTFEDLQLQTGPAFERMPDVVPAVRQVAELARLADAQKGVDHGADYYFQSALGARSVNGVRYGGTATVNGRATVLPYWLKSDQAGDAVHAILSSLDANGRHPSWSNGQPMHADDAARMQLIANPDGTYGLVNPKTNGLVRDAYGRPYKIGLESNRAWLAQRLGPGAVLTNR